MVIEKQEYKPGDVSTNLIRGAYKSQKIVTTLSGSAREAQISSGANRTEETPNTVDLFTTKSSEKDQNTLNKEALRSQIKQNALKEITAQQHENANNKAQSVIVCLCHKVFPEGLEYFNRPNQIAQTKEQAQEIAQEDFERVTKDPGKILTVMTSVFPKKISEMKSKANASGDQDDIKHYDKVEEILNKIFNVTKQINGNGSHVALLDLLDELDQSQIKGDLKGLISNYHDSLSDLGKQIQRANAQLINRTKHAQSELTTGVATKIDQGLRDSLYRRPESLAAAQRDHYGGIMGSIYDFKDTDWTLGGMPWEYGLNVKGSETASATPFPVRRLAGEMRGYIGTLTEAQPGPMFVTTDVEAKLRNTEMRNT